MPSELLRLAVIGTGAFGRHHVRILSDLPGVELVGIHDLDRELAGALAAEHGTRTFDDLQTLVGSCDAAVLAVPTVAHAEVGCRLIESGLHLLVEKPIAGSLEQADRLVDAASERGTVLAVGHVEYYNPAVQALLSVGAVPGYVEIQRRAGFSPRSLDIDVILDLMIHDLQILHALDRSAIHEIRATGIPVLSPRTDIANVRIAFASGMVASLTASRVSAERDRKLRAFFGDRYYSMNYEQQTIKGYRLSRGGEEPEIVPADLVIEAGEPLRLELESFVARCRGEEAPLADGGQGRRALQTALAIADEIDNDRRQRAGN